MKQKKKLVKILNNTFPRKQSSL